MAGKRGSIWYGFLEAGGKCSPMARDASLDTGNPATVYLFNLNKGRILEYRRDIVEGKLRELNAEEKGLKRNLKLKFEQARADFTPRGARRVVVKQPPRPEPEDVEIPDLEDGDGDMPIFDDAEDTPDDDDE